ncbi:helix-turn-helix domain-containing protein [Catellatospora sp. KI3]|uniref:TetR/AcrR family transcriptional regulator n=1 Tax=Catellatospora sp. KI3 TaxID=3041620 RepID=UPI002482FE3C|nr:TetR/AcrR family transcriptional regulator [Catellatospora sp. KI3]MDI1465924.1 helix-turn-helix domain-containing protein [Catellatospora sp. KI3]
MTDASPRRRVAPLAPEERRTAIIAATLPLLRAEGLHVSTRRIAECAGVAEGTLFRVFPDKAALLAAALAQAFDHAPTVAALRALSGVPDLRFRLRTAVKVLGQRFRENMPLMIAMRSGGLPAGVSVPDARDGFPRVVDALTELIAPDQHRLRLPADAVASVLTSMIMFSNRVDNLPVEEVVSVVLDGVLYPEVKEEPAC